MNRNNESGNVLFLILIAVALFAALSYAVTQSTRGGGNADNETKQIQIAQVVQHISEVRTALSRLMIINGCDNTDISFENANWSNGNYDHTPAASVDCQIYHPDGGGVAFRKIDTSLLHNSKSALSTYGQFAFSGGVWIYEAGDNNPDLTMMLPHLTEEACLAIQENLNISGSYLTIGNDWLGFINASNMAFDGDYATQFSLSTRRKESCLQLGGSDENYLFFVVLIDN